MDSPLTRAAVAALDDSDVLAARRDDFVLPEGVLYLDGNSLGALPRGTQARVATMVREEWGQGLIRSWNTAGWFDQPRVLGDRLAPLLGAAAGTVVVCDSTSLNLVKAVVAALRLRPERRVLVSDATNFPTDLYVTDGVLELLGGYEQRRLDATASLDDLLDDQVAVLVLSHVDYRTGRAYDMAGVTARAHEHGALVVWDLSHSAGALALDLTGCDVDLAVGCTYKYLNGGPGSPAFVYAAPRLQDQVRQPLSGWIGHAAPFAFDPAYEPAPGVSRFLVGTPPLLSYAALEASLDVWAQVDLTAVRAKSLRLTDLFITLVEQRCGATGLELVTPRVHRARGSHVSWRHPHAYPLVQALIDRGVIGDFRAPDLMRFGFAPLYLRHVDVWDAVDVLVDVLDSGAWRDPRYARRATVT